MLIIESNCLLLSHLPTSYTTVRAVSITLIRQFVITNSLKQFQQSLFFQHIPVTPPVYRQRSNMPREFRLRQNSRRSSSFIPRQFILIAKTYQLNMMPFIFFRNTSACWFCVSNYSKIRHSPSHIQPSCHCSCICAPILIL